VIFEKINYYIRKHEKISEDKTVLDSSIVEAKKPQNTREENEDIKRGEIPEKWKEDGRKLSQKDMEARFTKKNDQTYFGYKEHLAVDAESKIVTDYLVTTANIHDSQPAPELIENLRRDTEIFAD
jgi:IS5 family transposase